MKAGVPREMAYAVPHFSPGSAHVYPSEEAEVTAKLWGRSARPAGANKLN